TDSHADAKTSTSEGLKERINSVAHLRRKCIDHLRSADISSLVGIFLPLDVPHNNALSVGGLQNRNALVRVFLERVCERSAPATCPDIEGGIIEPTARISWSCMIVRRKEDSADRPPVGPV